MRDEYQVQLALVGELLSAMAEHVGTAMRHATGGLLGALHGETALPADLVAELEGRGTLLQLADDFAMEMTQSAALHSADGPLTHWATRYPAV